ncbi:DUF1559 domain-containing protein [Gimesia sp.]|uniref:DUF1559 family PulG-like putative transporter n=1 Tax=Gimesia sp. TaxID=2024833 RepID=UPI003A8EE847
MKLIRECLRHHSGFVMIELLTVILVIAILIALLLPAVQQAREAARATTCKNNLQQIGLALQNYQMAHRVLPSGTVNTSGPILNRPVGYHVGWLIQILPQLDEKAAFINYDFKYGVYDLKNRKIANHNIPGLYCPSNPNDTWNYTGCHNDAESPIDINNNGVLFLNSSIREKDLKDGRSHTIFIGEASDGGFLSWTSGSSSTLRNMGSKINSNMSTPKNYGLGFNYGGRGHYSFEENSDLAEMNEFETLSSPDFSDESPKVIKELAPEEHLSLLKSAGFSSNHTGGAHFCFGDGSVKYVSQLTEELILKNLANRHDSNLIGEF